MTKLQRASAAAYQAIKGGAWRRARTVLRGVTQGARQLLEALDRAATPARQPRPVPIRVDTRDRRPGNTGRTI